MKKLCALFGSLVALPSSVAAADWTPLITTTMFDGIRSDMLLAVSGILGLALIVFGLGMIMRVAGR